jgi:hypothetical protein
VNQQQIKHARERIHAIATLKIEQIQSHFAYKPNESLKTSLSKEEKYEQIKSGKAKLKAYNDDNFGSYTKWHEAYTYDTKVIDTNRKKGEAEQAKATEKVRTETNKVLSHRDQLIDELMFREDGAEVLKAIKAFEALDFTKASK